MTGWALFGVVSVLACIVLLAVGVRLKLLAGSARSVAAELDPGGDVTGPGRPGDVRSQLHRASDRFRVNHKALESRTRHLEEALSTIPQGVLICDRHGVVVFRNAVAESYARSRHGEALVSAAVEELLSNARRGVSGEQVLELFGPPRRTLVITGMPLGAEAGTAGDAGGLAVIEDISERRRHEAVRRDFVANISHELRTPVGALALLAETLREEDDPMVRERLAERMISEAERVGRTIEDLLTLSRIETGEEPDYEKVTAQIMIAEAVDRIRPAADQAGIDIEVKTPNPRLAVFGDRRQIGSALYNLLDNAVKYSNAGSRIEVFAGSDGLYVDLSVRDRGIGISESDLARIFERFYRVDQARSRQTGGTGLGLAIVRHVATNHRGDVVVDSTLGEGSTFTLRLPSASGPVAVATPEAG